MEMLGMEGILAVWTATRASELSNEHEGLQVLRSWECWMTPCIAVCYLPLTTQK